MTRRRKIGFVVAAIALCLGVIVTRVFWDGRAALADGDAAAARGDTREAITRWRRAARWYAPGAPHVRAAYGRLTDAAAKAHAAGDKDLELLAWTAVRSSILSTRSFYTPYAELLPEANDHIATLMAQTEGANVAAGQDEAARKAWHADKLRPENSAMPALGWSILALLGFATWVGGGFHFAWRGVGTDDRLVPRAAALSGLLVLVGMFAWMLGLYLA